MNTVWFDDAAPANATVSGDASFDDTQTATGSMALHFAASTAIRSWTFSGAPALTVTPADRLVLYALVNPCNPPRQLLVQWSDGTTQYRASWGENRIGDRDLATVNAGSVPLGGEWQRLEVVAKTLPSFGTADKSFTGMTISVDGGEAWIDTAGFASCSTAKAAKPSYLANETVWIDDATPPGATLHATYNWDSTQAASGSLADLVGTPADTGVAQHWFSNAPNGPVMKVDDMIVAYVFLDPCNPPKEVMLQWYDGSSWEHRAYWGDNRITAGSDGSSGRMRVGPLPELGKWVRLEVPAEQVFMEGRSAAGAAFALFDGQAWFDRSGRIPRINIARGKAALQSSGTDAALAVDGVLTTSNSTSFTPQPFWEVDLGKREAIESLQIHDPLSNLAPFWLLISDSALPDDLAGAKAQAPIAIRLKSEFSFFNLHAAGRYVRIPPEGTTTIQLQEVEIWAPASAAHANLAIGRAAAQSSTSTNANGAEAGVDGSLSNNPLTNFEPRPWWQVDLGALREISTISVFKSCCTSPLTNYYVLVSDDPMIGTLEEILLQPTVRAYFSATAPTIFGYPVGQRGRYVRVHVTGSTGLGLAEVQVWSQQPSLLPLSRTGVPER